MSQPCPYPSVTEYAEMRIRAIDRQIAELHEERNRHLEDIAKYGSKPALPAPAKRKGK